MQPCSFEVRRDAIHLCSYCIHIEDMTGRKAIPDSVETRVGFEDDPRAKYCLGLIEYSLEMSIRCGKSCRSS